MRKAEVLFKDQLAGLLVQDDEGVGVQRVMIRLDVADGHVKLGRIGPAHTRRRVNARNGSGLPRCRIEGASTSSCRLQGEKLRR